MYLKSLFVFLIIIRFIINGYYYDLYVIIFMDLFICYDLIIIIKVLKIIYRYLLKKIFLRLNFSDKDK